MSELENLLAKENGILRSEIAKLTSERDKAVNCIYSIQRALEIGDAGGAMGEVIAYNFDK